MALQRGAKRTSDVRKAGATPHAVIGATPPQFYRKPKGPLSMWGNDYKGCCVTSEEFFTKNCDGIDLTYHKAVIWARNHWALNGAGIWEVLTEMQTSGIYNGDFLYLDGPFKYVNFPNPAILRNAIVQGNVKIGVAADQIENVIQSYGVGKNGWVMNGFSKDINLDHCTSLNGYGPAGWLMQQVGGTLPRGVNPATPYLSMFTWSSIGLIDVNSMLEITGEAWLRTPGTIIKPNPVKAVTA